MTREPRSGVRPPGAKGCPEPSDLLAQTILEAARELEAAEERIKQAVLEAARQGDTQRVAELIARWIEGPVVEVLVDRQGTSDSGRTSRN